MVALDMCSTSSSLDKRRQQVDKNLDVSRPPPFCLQRIIPHRFMLDLGHLGKLLSIGG